MPALSKNQLLERIIEAVNASGWNVIYSPDMSSHPFKVRIYNEEKLLNLKIYIWNITHGGYPRSAQEYRIQVKLSSGIFEPEPGWILLILGWWEDGKVFTGFDYRLHSGHVGWSASFQVRLEALEQAYIHGFSPSDKGNGEIAVAFSPEYFIEYATHVTAFHSFGESRPDFDILEAVATHQVVNDQDLDRVATQRKIALRTIRQSLRDHSFTNRVLTAYSNRCAFCDIQLKLIEAAHILPVSYEGSTDETSNGIALCSLHHKAYDKSLELVSKIPLLGKSPKFTKKIQQL
ncbi:MAG: hypothetical protein Fur0017_30080 [Anaerolineales bacterium]